jgi:DNA-binding transcriptional ArsR family regulator
MVQHNLDHSFAALADATRRGILAELSREDASITHLASQFAMTLTGIKKHVAVLERAGLVTTRKIGRVRQCTLGANGLAAEAAWITAQRALFEARFSRLDTLLTELAQERPHDQRA